MKRTLILLVLICCSIALLSADQWIPALQDPSGGGGGGNSTPVDVVNFPTDEDGSLLVVTTVSNRVLDLLDTPVVLENGEDWISETFNAAPFNWIGIQVSALVTPQQGKLFCRVGWQYAAGEPKFFLSSPTQQTPGFSVIEVLLTSNLNPRNSGLDQVQMPVASIRCIFSDGGDTGSTAKLTDVKVLLRRE